MRKTLLLSIGVFGILSSTALFSNGQTFSPSTMGDVPASMSGTNAAMNPLQLLGLAVPAYDPTLTNTFKAKEFVISITPLWKTQVASGSTPYLSTAADYFFTKTFGLEGELVSLGNGQGSSTLDSGALMGIIRKDVGNLAGYALVGPSYNINTRRLGGDFGIGVEYRYRTGVGIFADTRYDYAGSDAANNGFLTRTGLHFSF